MSYYDSSANTIFGGSEIEAYVSDPLRAEIAGVLETIDAALQEALDKIVDEGGGITYQPKPLSDISTERPNVADVNMASFKLVALAPGTVGTDAVNKTQLDSGLALKYDKTTTLDAIVAPAADVSLATRKIVNLANATQPQDAATKSQLDAGLALKYDKTTSLDAIVAPAADVSLSTRKIVNLGQGVAPTDAITKAQLDAKVGNVQIKTEPDGSINWGQVAVGGVFSLFAGLVGGFLGNAASSFAGGMVTSISSATTAAAGAAGAALASAAAIGTNLVNSATGAIQRFGQSSMWGNKPFWEKFKEGAANFTDEQAESLAELGMIDPDDVKIFDDHMEFSGALENEENRMQYYEVDPEVVEQLKTKDALDQKLPNKEFGSDVLGSQMNLGRLNSTGAIKAPQMFSKQTFQLPDDPIKIQTKILDQAFPEAPPEFRQYTDEWGFSYWV